MYNVIVHFNSRRWLSIYSISARAFKQMYTQPASIIAYSSANTIQSGEQRGRVGERRRAQGMGLLPGIAIFHVVCCYVATYDRYYSISAPRQLAPLEVNLFYPAEVHAMWCLLCSASAPNVGYCKFDLEVPSSIAYLIHDNTSQWDIKYLLFYNKNLEYCDFNK